MEHVRQEFGSSLRQFIHCTNDDYTRAQIAQTVRDAIDKLNVGIREYQVICDESNNPISVTEDGRINVDLIIQPGPVSNFVEVKAVLTKEGCVWEKFPEPSMWPR
jgi:hypothetical protein